MQHIKVPVTELLRLMVNEEVARISPDSTNVLAIIGPDLHILVGDFRGIETAEDLNEIIQRNLST